MGDVSYRCVCGQTISLDTARGGACDDCGRHYTAEVLHDEVAKTVTISDLTSLTGQSASGDGQPDERIGQTLGHYKLESKLGQGGMGSVYRALDESLQRYVAIKVIHSAAHSIADTRQLQRLFQEAIAQARVNHPNVVHIYYVGRDGDVPFLAMELVAGTTLAHRLQDGPLPYGEVIRLGLQLADALRHSVAYDIVHADIKPGNVLLDEAGRVKLSDFGLARRLSQTEDGVQTLAGTPDYLAPEIAEGGGMDVRSDLYSLGVTLFEMTFGRLPYSYSSSTLRERLEAHASAAVEFPEPWPAGVPRAWRSVLARLLEKSPEKRYQNYDQLIADLKRQSPSLLPKAGRVQRGLAWLVDSALLQAMFSALSFPLLFPAMRDYVFTHSLAALGVAVTGAAPLLLASAVQAYWGLTPGKKIFQIRIVDRHGVKPDRGTLALRMGAQMATIWSNVLLLLFFALKLGAVGYVVVGVIQVGWLLDALVFIVRRDGRSLHDLFFGTRVVLDAGPSPAAADPHRADN